MYTAIGRRRWRKILRTCKDHHEPRCPCTAIGRRRWRKILRTCKDHEPRCPCVRRLAEDPGDKSFGHAGTTNRDAQVCGGWPNTLEKDPSDMQGSQSGNKN